MNSTSSADSARCTLHGTNGRRSAARRIARNTSGATEYGACAARLARMCVDDSSASSSRHARADEFHRALRTEADQLVEHDAGERAGAERPERAQRVADVADEGRTAATASAIAASIAATIGGRPRVRPAAAARHDAADPGDERRAGRHGLAQVRQLEVGVRVHEARQDGRRGRDPRRARRSLGSRRPKATIRPRSTATQPSRIGGSAIGSTHAA